MKKLLLNSLLVLALCFSVASCKEKSAESAEDAIEETMEETEEAVEETMEEAGEAIEEAGEAVGEAVQETEKSMEDLVEDSESVTVTFTYTALGKEVKGSKTFSGSQEEVESAVQRLTDSIKKIDPNVKITTGN